MKNWLECNTNKKVYIIPINKIDWLLTNWAFGWKRILDRLDKAVMDLQRDSPTGKITLIGHSSGGVMLRLYLSDNNFKGSIYNGYEKANCLITLGSPHQAEKATKLRAMVDNNYPGCYYSQHVKYISVAGEVDLNDPEITKFTRGTANASYRSIYKENNLKGDGIVPIKSALLNGSKNIILQKTCHSNIFGKYWYCSSERVKEWWSDL